MRGAVRVFGFVGVLLAGLTGTAPAQEGRVTFAAAAGGFFSVPVVSLKEARFRAVIKQKYDFSCGAASIASLLTFHYDRPTGEEEVFRAMFEAGDEDKIRKQGFSLLDMKTYLESVGYRADGFRIPLAKLAEVAIPAIVLIQTKGYKHFVLIKGIKDGEVLVGDPALGAKIYSRSKFAKVWINDIIFVIRDERKVAREHFNHAKDWAVRAKAPFGTALSREGLATFTTLLPTNSRF